MATKLEFYFSFAPPSENVQRRMHWAERNRLNENASCHILAALQNQCPQWRLFSAQKVRLKVTLHLKRRYDKDNAYGACKEPIVDNLRKFGLVFRDSPEWLEYEVHQVVDQKWQGTEVELEVVDSKPPQRSTAGGGRGTDTERDRASALGPATQKTEA